MRRPESAEDTGDEQHRVFENGRLDEVQLSATAIAAHTTSSTRNEMDRNPSIRRRMS